MRILLSFFLALILFSPLLHAGADELAPIPDAQSQVKAENEIQETFKDEFAKAKQGAGKLALANLLLKDALDTMDNPAARFVMLRHVRDLAAETGAVALAVRAIDEMARTYEINPFAMKADFLEKAGKNILSPTQPSNLAGHALALAETAIIADQLSDAVRLNALALGFARASPTLSQQAKDQLAHLQQARKAFEFAKPAFELLKEKPDDPEANLIAGKQVCFVKGNWELGLPMLAKGTDAKLRGLAEKESTNPTDATEQMNLGDEWWAIADKQQGLGQLNIQRHAYKWYETAMPGLNGPDQITVEKRINKVDYRLRTSATAAIWDHLDITEAKVKEDYLRLEKKRKITTLQAYAGPIEITVVARTQKNNIRLHAFKTALVIFNWEGNPEELRCHWNDGKGGIESGSRSSTRGWGPLEPNTWYELTWRISDLGMMVLVDGKEIFKESKKQNLTLKAPVSVYSKDHVIDVKSVTVKPWK